MINLSLIRTYQIVDLISLVKVHFEITLLLFKMDLLKSIFYLNFKYLIIKDFHFAIILSLKIRHLCF